MARGKKHTGEQIVNLLRQVEVGVANGKTLPQAMSFNTIFSRLNSDTNRFSFAFSCSRSFSLRAWSTFNPPYSLRHR